MLQPLQAGLDRIDDVAARGAAVVGAGADLAEGLGGDNDVGALVAGIGDRPPGDLLRQPLRVDVGGVDEVDAGVEGAGDDAVGIGLVEQPIAGQKPPRPPKVMVPRQISETRRPVPPRFL